ncbi:hypothetical protein ACIBMZ_20830 [Micromonospora sp. NPDC049900]|uniref:hypothetical protein n=1 Tax=Micromonospora sp. NPDC049900 TaxID=3364275 RepID=UPI0037B03027
MLITADDPATTSALIRRGIRRWLATALDLTRGGGVVPDKEAGTAAENVQGFAIRREWRNGSHDLFGFTPDKEVAERSLVRDKRYWLYGPVRPEAVFLLPVNAADVDRHPVDGCFGSLCPDTRERGELR